MSPEFYIIVFSAVFYNITFISFIFVVTVLSPSFLPPSIACPSSRTTRFSHTFSCDSQYHFFLAY